MPPPPWLFESATARLVVEGGRAARGQPIASVVTALLVAAACSVVIATTGRTIQAERQVLAEIDRAGTRTIRVEDVRGTAGLSAEALDRINAISATHWAIGLGFAEDARPAPVQDSSRVLAVRSIWGRAPTDIVNLRRLTHHPPGAIAGADARRTFGLAEGVGGFLLEDYRDLPVVGTFDAEEPLSALDAVLLRTPKSTTESIQTIVITARSAAEVPGLAAVLPSVLNAHESDAVRIETSEGFATLRRAVHGQLGSFGRDLAAIVLAISTLLVALNVYGSVSSRAATFGRRRALGASRSAIVLMVCSQTILPAAVGALLGTLTTSAVLRAVTSAWPDGWFAVSVSVLAVWVAALASIVPAIMAAYQDPVKVLRVP